MKCDEERPACRECRKTGRICDGFDNSGEKTTAETPSLLYGKLYGLSSVANGPSHLGFLRRGDELHSFAYFHQKTKQHINAAYVLATRVQRLILQASHANISSIKHMVVALGSLTEHLEEFKLLSPDLDRKRRLQYADIQYFKSIGALAKEMAAATQPSTEMVLVSCLLLSLFDFLRGEQSNARTHLAAGIDILQRCFSSEADSLLAERRINHSQCWPDPLIQDFASIFSVTDLYSAIWLGRPCFHSKPMMIQPTRYMIPVILDENKPHSLSELSANLNHQLVRAHCFHHFHFFRTRDDCPTESAPSLVEDALNEKKKLTDQLEKWPCALEKCISNLPDPLPDDLVDRIVLMRINYHSLHASLSTFFDDASQVTPLKTFDFSDRHRQQESFQASLSIILEGGRFLLARDNGRITRPAFSIMSTTTNSSFTVPTPTASHANTSSSDFISASTAPPIHHALLRAIAANCLEPDPYNIRIFAFVAGAIQPLYLVASQSPERKMREEALSLLETKPWREGAWDSRVMARLARGEGSLDGWKIKVEEER